MSANFHTLKGLHCIHISMKLKQSLSSHEDLNAYGCIAKAAMAIPCQ